MKERLRGLCLSRSSGKSGPSLTTPDITVESSSGTQTKEISSSKNNSKGMLCMDIQDLETKVALLFILTVWGNMEG